MIIVPMYAFIQVKDMIEIQKLSKTFKTNDGEFEALKNISLTINDGEIFGIIGMSGAGKSTLVRCINMLERPTNGSVIIDGVDIGLLSQKELRQTRRNVTMIFQGFNLLMQRNVLKNVCFPLELAGVSKNEAEKRALELLETVGLKEKAGAYPAQLSGGQQQRVAIARALTTNPKVLLCDEATSALDPKTTRSILALIKDINKKLGITVVIITHAMSVIEEICDKVAIIDGGEIAEMGAVSDIFSSPRSIAARNLVYPEESSYLENTDNNRILRLVFGGEYSADVPLIAQLAMKKGIAANIIMASTKTINGNAVGSMLLRFKSDSDLIGAKEYFGSIDKIVCEVLKNV